MNTSKSQTTKGESTSKSAKPVYVPPGSLVRGRGQSFSVLGSVRVNAEQRGLIGKSKTFSVLASDQNKITHNDSFAPLCFEPILEGDAPLPHHEEVMQGTQREPCESEKAKKVRGTNRCKNAAGLKVGEKLSVAFLSLHH
ncbi:uncharacterized protein LOC107813501 [Nicotiana tabacum]|uniref:Uncharacterized protein LOC107813501 n=1 Tax=Nicotiana tabacum TaxID=4097 RepID=A0AC58UMV8_TOBAC